MSPYSTLYITREDAEYELSERGLSIPRSDEDIEGKLFELFESALYNFRIVSEYTEEEDWRNWYRGRLSHVETPDSMIEENRPKAYQHCPHCGEKL